MGAGNLGGVLLIGDKPRGLVRSACAIALGCVSVAAPLMLDREWPVFRTVMAFGFAAGFLRVIQIVRRPKGTTLGGRVLSVVLPVIDARRIVHVPRQIRLDLFAEGAVEGALAVALFL